MRCGEGEAQKVTEREPVQSETVKQTEPVKQSEAETPATKPTTENNNPPPAETPTQTASENTKTAYDFEFDMEAIMADCISIGQSMGLRGINALGAFGFGSSFGFRHKLAFIISCGGC